MAEASLTKAGNNDELQTDWRNYARRQDLLVTEMKQQFQAPHASPGDVGHASSEASRRTGTQAGERLLITSGTGNQKKVLKYTLGDGVAILDSWHTKNFRGKTTSNPERKTLITDKVDGGMDGAGIFEVNNNREKIQEGLTSKTQPNRGKGQQGEHTFHTTYKLVETQKSTSHLPHETRRVTRIHETTRATRIQGVDDEQDEQRQETSGRKTTTAFQSKPTQKQRSDNPEKQANNIKVNQWLTQTEQGHQQTSHKTTINGKMLSERSESVFREEATSTARPNFKGYQLEQQIHSQPAPLHSKRLYRGSSASDSVGAPTTGRLNLEAYKFEESREEAKPGGREVGKLTTLHGQWTTQNENDAVVTNREVTVPGKLKVQDFTRHEVEEQNLARETVKPVKKRSAGDWIVQQTTEESVLHSEPAPSPAPQKLNSQKIDFLAQTNQREAVQEMHRPGKLKIDAFQAQQTQELQSNEKLQREVGKIQVSNQWLVESTSEQQQLHSQAPVDRKRLSGDSFAFLQREEDNTDSGVKRGPTSTGRLNLEAYKFEESREEAKPADREVGKLTTRHGQWTTQNENDVVVTNREVTVPGKLKVQDFIRHEVEEQNLARETVKPMKKRSAGDWIVQQTTEESVFHSEPAPSPAPQKLNSQKVDFLAQTNQREAVQEMHRPGKLKIDAFQAQQTQELQSNEKPQREVGKIQVSNQWLVESTSEQQQLHSQAAVDRKRLSGDSFAFLQREQDNTDSGVKRGVTSTGRLNLEAYTFEESREEAKPADREVGKLTTRHGQWTTQNENDVVVTNREVTVPGKLKVQDFTRHEVEEQNLARETVKPVKKRSAGDWIVQQTTEESVLHSEPAPSPAPQKLNSQKIDFLAQTNQREVVQEMHKPGKLKIDAFQAQQSQELQSNEKPQREVGKIQVSNQWLVESTSEQQQLHSQAAVDRKRLSGDSFAFLQREQDNTDSGVKRGVTSTGRLNLEAYTFEESREEAKPADREVGKLTTRHGQWTTQNENDVVVTNREVTVPGKLKVQDFTRHEVEEQNLARETVKPVKKRSAGDWIVQQTTEESVLHSEPAPSPAPQKLNSQKIDFLAQTNQREVVQEMHKPGKLKIDAFQAQQSQELQSNEKPQREVGKIQVSNQWLVESTSEQQQLHSQAPVDRKRLSGDSFAFLQREQDNTDSGVKRGATSTGRLNLEAYTFEESREEAKPAVREVGKLTTLHGQWTTQNENDAVVTNREVTVPGKLKVQDFTRHEVEEENLARETVKPVKKRSAGDWIVQQTTEESVLHSEPAPSPAPQKLNSQKIDFLAQTNQREAVQEMQRPGKLKIDAFQAQQTQELQSNEKPQREVGKIQVSNQWLVESTSEQQQLHSQAAVDRKRLSGDSFAFLQREQDNIDSGVKRGVTSTGRLNLEAYTFEESREEAKPAVREVGKLTTRHGQWTTQNENDVVVTNREVTVPGKLKVQDFTRHEVEEQNLARETVKPVKKRSAGDWIVQQTTEESVLHSEPAPSPAPQKLNSQKIDFLAQTNQREVVQEMHRPGKLKIDAFQAQQTQELQSNEKPQREVGKIQVSNQWLVESTSEQQQLHSQAPVDRKRLSGDSFAFLQREEDNTDSGVKRGATSTGRLNLEAYKFEESREEAKPAVREVGKLTTLHGQWTTQNENDAVVTNREVTVPGKLKVQDYTRHEVEEQNLARETVKPVKKRSAGDWIVQETAEESVLHSEAAPSPAPQKLNSQKIDFLAQTNQREVVQEMHRPGKLKIDAFQAQQTQELQSNEKPQREVGKIQVSNQWLVESTSEQQQLHSQAPVYRKRLSGDSFAFLQREEDNTDSGVKQGATSTGRLNLEAYTFEESREEAKPAVREVGKLTTLHGQWTTQNENDAVVTNREVTVPGKLKVQDYTRHEVEEQNLTRETVKPVKKRSAGDWIVQQTTEESVLHSEPAPSPAPQKLNSQKIDFLAQTNQREVVQEMHRPGKLKIDAFQAQQTQELQSNEKPHREVGKIQVSNQWLVESTSEQQQLHSQAPVDRKRLSGDSFAFLQREEDNTDSGVKRGATSTGRLNLEAYTFEESREEAKPAVREVGKLTTLHGQWKTQNENDAVVTNREVTVPGKLKVQDYTRHEVEEQNLTRETVKPVKKRSAGDWIVQQTTEESVLHSEPAPSPAPQKLNSQKIDFLAQTNQREVVQEMHRPGKLKIDAFQEQQTQELQSNEKPQREVGKIQVSNQWLVESTSEQQQLHSQAPVYRKRLSGDSFAFLQREEDNTDSGVKRGATSTGRLKLEAYTFEESREEAKPAVREVGKLTTLHGQWTTQNENDAVVTNREVTVPGKLKVQDYTRHEVEEQNLTRETVKPVKKRSAGDWIVQQTTEESVLHSEPAPSPAPQKLNSQKIDFLAQTNQREVVQEMHRPGKLKIDAFQAQQTQELQSNEKPHREVGKIQVSNQWLVESTSEQQQLHSQAPVDRKRLSGDSFAFLQREEDNTDSGVKRGATSTGRLNLEAYTFEESREEAKPAVREVGKLTTLHGQWTTQNENDAVVTNREVTVPGKLKVQDYTRHEVEEQNLTRETVKPVKKRSAGDWIVQQTTEESVLHSEPAPSPAPQKLNSQKIDFLAQTNQREVVQEMHRPGKLKIDAFQAQQTQELQSNEKPHREVGKIQVSNQWLVESTSEQQQLHSQAPVDRKRLSGDSFAFLQREEDNTDSGVKRGATSTGRLNLEAYTFEESREEAKPAVREVGKLTTLHGQWKTQNENDAVVTNREVTVPGKLKVQDYTRHEVEEQNLTRETVKPVKKRSAGDWIVQQTTEESVLHSEPAPSPAPQKLNSQKIDFLAQTNQREVVQEMHRPGKLKIDAFQAQQTQELQSNEKPQREVGKIQVSNQWLVESTSEQQQLHSQAPVDRKRLSGDSFAFLQREEDNTDSGVKRGATSTGRLKLEAYTFEESTEEAKPAVREVGKLTTLHGQWKTQNENDAVVTNREVTVPGKLKVQDYTRHEVEEQNLTRETVKPVKKRSAGDWIAQQTTEESVLHSEPAPSPAPQKLNSQKIDFLAQTNQREVVQEMHRPGKLKIDAFQAQQTQELQSNEKLQREVGKIQVSNQWLVESTSEQQQLHSQAPVDRKRLSGDSFAFLQREEDNTDSGVKRGATSTGRLNLEAYTFEESREEAKPAVREVGKLTTLHGQWTTQNENDAVVTNREVTVPGKLKVQDYTRHEVEEQNLTRETVKPVKKRSAGDWIVQQTTEESVLHSEPAPSPAPQKLNSQKIDFLAQTNQREVVQEMHRPGKLKIDAFQAQQTQELQSNEKPHREVGKIQVSNQWLVESTSEQQQLHSQAPVDRKRLSGDSFAFLQREEDNTDSGVKRGATSTGRLNLEAYTFEESREEAKPAVREVGKLTTLHGQWKTQNENDAVVTNREVTVPGKLKVQDYTRHEVEEQNLTRETVKPVKKRSAGDWIVQQTTEESVLHSEPAPSPAPQKLNSQKIDFLAQTNQREVVQEMHRPGKLKIDAFQAQQTQELQSNEKPQREVGKIQVSNQWLVESTSEQQQLHSQAPVDRKRLSGDSFAFLQREEDNTDSGVKRGATSTGRLKLEAYTFEESREEAKPAVREVGKLTTLHGQWKTQNENDAVVTNREVTVPGKLKVQDYTRHEVEEQNLTRETVKPVKKRSAGDWIAQQTTEESVLHSEPAPSPAPQKLNSQKIDFLAQTNQREVVQEMHRPGKLKIDAFQAQQTQELQSNEKLQREVGKIQVSNQWLVESTSEQQQLHSQAPVDRKRLSGDSFAFLQREEDNTDSGVKRGATSTGRLNLEAYTFEESREEAKPAVREVGKLTTLHGQWKTQNENDAVVTNREVTVPGKLKVQDYTRHEVEEQNLTRETVKPVKKRSAGDWIVQQTTEESVLHSEPAPSPAPQKLNSQKIDFLAQTNQREVVQEMHRPGKLKIDAFQAQQTQELQSNEKPQREVGKIQVSNQWLVESTSEQQQLHSQAPVDRKRLSGDSFAFLQREEDNTDSGVKRGATSTGRLKLEAYTFEESTEEAKPAVREVGKLTTLHGQWKTQNENDAVVTNREVTVPGKLKVQDYTRHEVEEQNLTRETVKPVKKRSAGDWIAQQTTEESVLHSEPAPSPAPQKLNSQKIDFLAQTNQREVVQEMHRPGKLKIDAFQAQQTQELQSNEKLQREVGKIQVSNQWLVESTIDQQHLHSLAAVDRKRLSGDSFAFLQREQDNTDSGVKRGVTSTGRLNLEAYKFEESREEAKPAVREVGKLTTLHGQWTTQNENDAVVTNREVTVPGKLKVQDFTRHEVEEQNLARETVKPVKKRSAGDWIVQQTTEESVLHSEPAPSPAPQKLNSQKIDFLAQTNQREVVQEMHRPGKLKIDAFQAQQTQELQSNEKPQREVGKIQVSNQWLVESTSEQQQLHSQAPVDRKRLSGDSFAFLQREEDNTDSGVKRGATSTGRLKLEAYTFEESTEEAKPAVREVGKLTTLHGQWKTQNENDAVVTNREVTVPGKLKVQDYTRHEVEEQNLTRETVKPVKKRSAGDWIAQQTTEESVLHSEPAPSPAPQKLNSQKIDFLAQTNQREVVQEMHRPGKLKIDAFQAQQTQELQSNEKLQREVGKIQVSNQWLVESTIDQQHLHSLAAVDRKRLSGDSFAFLQREQDNTDSGVKRGVTSTGRLNLEAYKFEESREEAKPAVREVGKLTTLHGQWTTQNENDAVVTNREVTVPGKLKVQDFTRHEVEEQNLARETVKPVKKRSAGDWIVQQTTEESVLHSEPAPSPAPQKLNSQKIDFLAQTNQREAVQEMHRPGKLKIDAFQAQQTQELQSNEKPQREVGKIQVSNQWLVESTSEQQHLHSQAAVDRKRLSGDSFAFLQREQDNIDSGVKRGATSTGRLNLEAYNFEESREEAKPAVREVGKLTTLHGQWTTQNENDAVVTNREVTVPGKLKVQDFTRHEVEEQNIARETVKPVKKRSAGDWIVQQTTEESVLHSEPAPSPAPQKLNSQKIDFLAQTNQREAVQEMHRPGKLKIDAFQAQQTQELQSNEKPQREVGKIQVSNQWLVESTSEQQQLHSQGPVDRKRLSGDSFAFLQREEDNTDSGVKRGVTSTGRLNLEAYKFEESREEAKPAVREVGKLTTLHGQWTTQNENDAVVTNREVTVPGKLKVQDFTRHEVEEQNLARETVKPVKKRSAGDWIVQQTTEESVLHSEPAPSPAPQKLNSQKIDFLAQTNQREVVQEMHRPGKLKIDAFQAQQTQELQSNEKPQREVGKIQVSNQWLVESTSEQQQLHSQAPVDRKRLSGDSFAFLQREQDNTDSGVKRGVTSTGRPNLEAYNVEESREEAKPAVREVGKLTTLHGQWTTQNENDAVVTNREVTVPGKLKVQDFTRHEVEEQNLARGTVKPVKKRSAGDWIVQQTTEESVLHSEPAPSPAPQKLNSQKIDFLAQTNQREVVQEMHRPGKLKVDAFQAQQTQELQTNEKPQREVGKIQVSNQWLVESTSEQQQLHSLAPVDRKKLSGDSFAFLQREQPNTYSGVKRGAISTGRLNLEAYKVDESREEAKPYSREVGKLTTLHGQWTTQNENDAVVTNREVTVPGKLKVQDYTRHGVEELLQTVTSVQKRNAVDSFSSKREGFSRGKVELLESKRREVSRENVKSVASESENVGNSSASIWRTVGVSAADSGSGTSFSGKVNSTDDKELSETVEEISDPSRPGVIVVRKITQSTSRSESGGTRTQGSWNSGGGVIGRSWSSQENLLNNADGYGKDGPKSLPLHKRDVGQEPGSLSVASLCVSRRRGPRTPRNTASAVF